MSNQGGWIASRLPCRCLISLCHLWPHLLQTRTPVLTAARGGFLPQRSSSSTAGSAAFSSTRAKGPASGPVPLPAVARLPGINNSAESLIACPCSQPLAHLSRDGPSSSSNPGQSGRATLSHVLHKPSCSSLALCAEGTVLSPSKEQRRARAAVAHARGWYSAQCTQPVQRAWALGNSPQEQDPKRSHPNILFSGVEFHTLPTVLN